MDYELAGMSPVVEAPEIDLHYPEIFYRNGAARAPGVPKAVTAYRCDSSPVIRRGCCCRRGLSWLSKSGSARNGRSSR